MVKSARTEGNDAQPPGPAAVNFMALGSTRAEIIWRAPIRKSAQASDPQWLWHGGRTPPTGARKPATIPETGSRKPDMPLPPGFHKQAWEWIHSTFSWRFQPNDSILIIFSLLKCWPGLRTSMHGIGTIIA